MTGSRVESVIASGSAQLLSLTGYRSGVPDVSLQPPGDIKVAHVLMSDT